MSTLINHIKKCLNLTDEYKSKITPEILNIHGILVKKQDIFIIIFVQ